MKIKRFANRLAISTAILFAITTSAWVPAQAATLPSVPQSVTAWTGNDQLFVTWSTPVDNGGDPNLVYVVTAAPLSSSASTLTCSTKELGCSISNLQSGEGYLFSVVASNSAGPGYPSTQVQITPGKTTPPPQSFTATQAASGMITASWKPLSSVVDGTFAWYSVSIFKSSLLGSGSQIAGCTTWPITESTCLIGGLKVGVKYFAQISTWTSRNGGLPSTPRIEIFFENKLSASTTKKPSPPLSVKVVAGNKLAEVSWKTPLSNGGSSITSYIATAKSSKGAVVSQCKVAAKGSTCSISKLTNGVVYRISVVAVNAKGVSDPSAVVLVRPKTK